VGSERITDRFNVGTLADGSRLQMPIEELEVDISYIQGSTEAWVLDIPLYDFITGIVDGVLPLDQPYNS